MSELNMEAERAAFEAWTRADIGMPDATPFNWESDWVKAALEGWMERARRTAPVSAPLDTQALPPLPMTTFVPSTRFTFTAQQMQQYARDHAAPYAARIAHLERELDQARCALKGSENARKVAERAAEADGKPASINPMCERKTTDIVQREGYEKTGYVLKKAGERICVSDGGAVAWFTTDEWNWLMFNRDHVEFNWPKPLAYIDGRTAGTAPEAKVVAWAVTAERGGIHKLSITKESAERKAAAWREEWPNNGCKVRPLVFGDAAAPSPQSKQEEAE